jgi:uncharacterized protein YecE (DUF72 family)
MASDEEMSIHVGTSGWSYEHWKGRFYPEDLAKSRWFEFYAKHFNSVEVNATFYRNFADTTYTKWRERAPEGFRYVLKVPRQISHRQKLNGVEALIKEFARSANLLGERLGLLLLQLPPHLPYQPERLEAALQAFGSPSLVAVEFRDEGWLTEEVFSLLQHQRANFCNPDSPQQSLSGKMTGRVGYLRLHGRRSWYTDEYTRDELCVIAETAHTMCREGADEVYIFFNNDTAAHAPMNASALIELL